MKEITRKNRMIIIEGPQGTGKTTLAEYLRDNIPASNLYRLSGQRDKSKSGKKLSEYMYQIQVDYLEKMGVVPMDLIFDRTFFTEEVYARLGYKDYSFADVYQNLVKRLEKTNYEIYLVLLYLENTDLYLSRLKREQHHNYQAFSLQNSIDQQKTYLQLGEELKDSRIHVVTLAMDDFNNSYQEINKIFNIGSDTIIKKDQIGRM